MFCWYFDKIAITIPLQCISNFASKFMKEMKKVYLLLVFAMATVVAAHAQFKFPVEASLDYSNKTVVMPKSPLKTQILFIGSTDSVQTVGKDGKPNGFALAKEWHDFIGFTADTTPGTKDLGWLSVNHEMIWSDDKIGDGGGNTSFKVRRKADGTLEVVDQTLADGRKGKFFAVDFANTVGETGMNCAGITAPDGRIWTAEEWFRTNNASIANGSNSPIGGNGAGVRDTADWTISTTIPGDFNGKTIKKFQNFNYMVEIDPRTAKAIRKQYNWGRAGWEGGVVMPNNKTVYLGIDESPAPWVKFEADVAGDFTKGKLYAWKADGTWVQLVNDKFDEINDLSGQAFKKGAAMFNRNEWVTYNPTDGKVYWAETGRDGFNFTADLANGAAMSPHWAAAYKMRNPSFTGTDAAALDSVANGKFIDYYGRVLYYDPATSQVGIYLEAGPYLPTSPSLASYPAKHLSNPDGLGVVTINGRTFMMIQEDLNGRSFGRMPAEYQSSALTVCETFFLDMSIKNPTINDLVRIAATPHGAEITGVIASPDGKTVFMNSQHPAATNPFPYNHSLTFAITGWENVVNTFVGLEEFNNNQTDIFSVYPNPVSRELHLNQVSDVAIYDLSGKRLKVLRNVELVDVTDLASGTYIIMNSKGETQKLVVE